MRLLLPLLLPIAALAAPDFSSNLIIILTPFLSPFAPQVVQHPTLALYHYAVANF